MSATPRLPPNRQSAFDRDRERLKAQGHLHTEGDRRIFVFGSNLQGMHGGGAAWYAANKLGAQMGVAEGLTGQTYALPTCAFPGQPLTIPQVAEFVRNFIEFAKCTAELNRLSPDPIRGPVRFFVSEVGCGIAGLDPNDAAPLFVDAPDNCDLPPTWRCNRTEWTSDSSRCRNLPERVGGECVYCRETRELCEAHDRTIP